jgi:hypothetical protein
LSGVRSRPPQVATFSYKYFARIDGARREKIRPPPLNLVRPRAAAELPPMRAPVLSAALSADYHAFGLIGTALSKKISIF